MKSRGIFFSAWVVVSCFALGGTYMNPPAIAGGTDKSPRYFKGFQRSGFLSRLAGRSR